MHCRAWVVTKRLCWVVALKPWCGDRPEGKEEEEGVWIGGGGETGGGGGGGGGGRSGMSKNSEDEGGNGEVGGGGKVGDSMDPRA